jgi:transposase
VRVVDIRVKDVNELVCTVFSGLYPLVIRDVADEGERIVVRARTPQHAADCPVCGASSGRVHGYLLRTVADVPVDDRRVVVCVRVRRLVCPTLVCRHTFREQVPGVLERYQRRTIRLTRHVKAVVKELAGRAGHDCWRNSRWASRATRPCAPCCASRLPPGGRPA